MTVTSTEFGFLLTLHAGDELIRSLIQFARAQEVDAAIVSGIGSVSEVELGTGSGREREQRRCTITEPLEACSLTGTLTLLDGEPFPHLHGTFSRADHAVIGGHVYQAVSATTIELAIQVTSHALARFARSAAFATGTLS